MLDSLQRQKLCEFKAYAPEFRSGQESCVAQLPNLLRSRSRTTKDVQVVPTGACSQQQPMGETR